MQHFLKAKIFISKTSINTTAMKTTITVLITLACACIAAYGQQAVNCINADFESGNFDNWAGKTGACCPVTMSTTGLVPGRHTIVEGTGSDPLSLDLIPYTPPGGGKYIARLGNSNVGAESEQLLYSFTVTGENSLFAYRYAVVLEDPGHAPEDQPRFSIRVYDSNGDSITCGTYNVVASASIPGFVNNGDLRIKPWTEVGIDLSAYVGQTVTIEFTTADCGMGGHFGYAYIECSCASFEIISDICPGNKNIVVLHAPAGFEKYEWNDGSTADTLEVNFPLVEKWYSCILTSVTGCTITLTKAVEPKNIHAAFYITEIINGFNFMDSSYVIGNPLIVEWHWNFGDAIISSDQNPAHAYETLGKYTVHLTVTNEDGCSDTAKKEISTPSYFYFPNAFSPNGDGRNDFFSGSVSGYKAFELFIFDRYGKEVFKTNNPKVQWNGKFKNNPGKEGSYIYKANIIDLYEKNHVLAGTVNLIR